MRIPSPDEMHWGINCLREDIQDIRAEAQESRAEMRAEFTALRAALQAGDESLRSEARKFRSEVTAEFAEVRRQMQASEASPRNATQENVASLRGETRAGDASLCTEMAALREFLLMRIDNRFYWTIGLMATMMGVHTALTVALTKL